MGTGRGGEAGPSLESNCACKEVAVEVCAPAPLASHTLGSGRESAPPGTQVPGTQLCEPLCGLGKQAASGEN